MRINDLSRTAVPKSQDYQQKPAVQPGEQAAAVPEAPQAQPAPEFQPLGDNGAMNDEMLKKSVEQANKSLKMYNRMIERSVHEVTHTIMYKLKDTVTNEVIQEFPPKKIQDMIAKMWELAGLFVDEKA